MWLQQAAVILCTCFAFAAAPPPTRDQLDHVHGAGTKAQMLLREGSRRSPTFNELLEELDTSDVLVWVETRHLQRPAELMLVTAAAHHRYVRISISIPGLDSDLIAWLGHELQHAVEIARAPAVRDQDTLRRLYQSIGAVESVGGHAETAKAQQVWASVLREVRASQNREWTEERWR